MSIGFTFPFVKLQGQLGLFETTSDDISATIQNIKSLIFTDWGERVMRRNLGANLKEFIFEQIDSDEVRTRVSDRIAAQISTWLPYVVLDEITVKLRDDDPTIQENAMKVSIKFRLNSKPDSSTKFDTVVTS